MTNQIFAYGIGVATKNQKGEIIEVYYPNPRYRPSEEETTELLTAINHSGTVSLNDFQKSDLRACEISAITDTLEPLMKSDRTIVVSILHKDEAPADVGSAYLKLHLLSHRLVKPNTIVLDGMFGVLKNLAWTNEGPIDLAELPERQLKARLERRVLSVDCVDKFPKMTDYVVPSGIRIGDTSRIRLGAYVGDGTTVMHEGFINFNAGTEGPAMIEGRISAGVWVGANSDLGGGSSTMGTLSGGGNIVISVGENCLIGANAGTGIPLGDRCTIESGLYVTAGTKVSLMHTDGSTIQTTQARTLANQNDLLFRRNSVTGAVECLTNNSSIELNEALHSN